ncbi:uncharacterized protein G6M90_00g011200 [Metarhizium brunneum]|uniref:Uncharacterized protein n=1 Tax=Metarhizium brunneum TaxID=500148 RepID=A0A7D5YWX4_9HYPO|nr:hypothetical protein G6M90_00g011200 [Metarhizium brunneum]
MDFTESSSVIAEDEQRSYGNMATHNMLPEPNSEIQVLQKLCELDNVIKTGFSHVLDMLSPQPTLEISPSDPPIAGSGSQIHSIVEEAKNSIEWEEVEQLKGQLKIAEDKIRKKTAKLNSMTENLEEAKTQIKKLKAKELKLRNVILQNSEDDVRSDEEIVQMFRGIRQKLLAIAHSRLINWQVNFFPCTPGLNPSVKNFHHRWQRSPLNNRRHILRAKLYSYIHYHILNRNLFGFGQVMNLGGGGNNTCDALESYSREMEKFLVQRGVPDEQLTNWRLSTMKCAQLVQCSSLSDCQASDLLMFTLKPLLHHNCSQEQLEQLRNQIRDVCEKAIEFRLAMRQSKDLYKCQMIGRGQIVSPDIPAEAVEVQGDGDAGNVIVGTFFGALLKHAKSRGEDEVVVLERAHVLVKSA